MCDCGCSTRDPDCDNVANPVRGCVDGLVCARDGRCITQDTLSDADSVFASSACADIKIPGTFFTSGRAYSNVADASMFCPACPNDLLFNQVMLYSRIYVTISPFFPSFVESTLESHDSIVSVWLAHISFNTILPEQACIGIVVACKRF